MFGSKKLIWIYEFQLSPKHSISKYRLNRNVCKSAPKDTYKNVHRSAICKSKNQAQSKYPPTAEPTGESRYSDTVEHRTAVREQELLLSMTT